MNAVSLGFVFSVVSGWDGRIAKAFQVARNNITCYYLPQGKRPILCSEYGIGGTEFGRGIIGKNIIGVEVKFWQATPQPCISVAREWVVERWG